MKGRHKPSDRLLSMISLAITYVLAGLLLFFIGNSLIPQVADSFQNLLNSLNTYYPRILSFLRENGIDTAELEAAIGRIDLNEI